MTFDNVAIDKIITLLDKINYMQKWRKLISRLLCLLSLISNGIQCFPMTRTMMLIAAKGNSGTVGDGSIVAVGVGVVVAVVVGVGVGATVTVY